MRNYCVPTAYIFFFAVGKPGKRTHLHFAEERAGVGVEDVLEEVELSARLEDALDLREDLGHVLDGAEDEGDDHGVHGVVPEHMEVFPDGLKNNLKMGG